MNNEYEYLIELTNKYLNNEKAVLKKDIDYRQVLSIAAKHNLFGIIYCALSNAENKEIINPAVLSFAKEKFFDLVYFGTQQSNAEELLKNALTGSEIRFVLFKGAALRNLYPVPESRVMGDIDVLIDTESRKKAHSALKDAGFVCENANGPVWDYKINDVLIEVHTSLLNDSIDLQKTAQGFEDAMNHAVYNKYSGHFDDTYHFEYLIAHTAHHFRFYGAGIKLILDLAFIIKYGNTDLQRALNELDNVGLGRFAREILSVCFKWYGVGIPFINDVSKTENFLVSYGAFGGSERNSSAVIARRDIERGKSTSSFLMGLRLAFPSYEKLKNIPYIKFINGKPWLTPLAWIYRFFYNIKNRQKFMLKTAKGLNSKNTAEAAQHEYEYFKEIGLI